MFSENHSIWSYFYLRKISCHNPQDVKKGTNNRNFYTDIYPIFPQVLSYYVRVFDVCGALQYFNVLSPPPPLLSSLPPPSDVWVSRHCCDSRNSPRVQCALMSQRLGWSWSHSLSSQVTALSPGARHFKRGSCSGPCPWSQTNYLLSCLTFPF